MIVPNYPKILCSRYAKLPTDINQIAVRCIMQNVISKDKHCFELYGYDILIDSELTPWLIEINGNPSLTANTQLDSDNKIKMLDDMLTILDLEKIMTGNEDQVGGFDIICRGSVIKNNPMCMYNTKLGGFNNREKQLKQLAKQTNARLATLYLQKKHNVGDVNKDK